MGPIPPFYVLILVVNFCTCPKSEYELFRFDYKPSVLLAEKLNDNLSETDLMHFGMRLLEAKEYEDAVWCFTEAITKNPSEVAYYRLRANCYSKMGNFDLAISDYTDAVRMDPHNWNDKLGLSLILVDRGKFDEAFAETLHFDDEMLSMLGDRLRYFNQKFEAALLCYSKAIEINPNHYAYYRKRANCYLEMKDWDKAMADFKKYLLMYPKDTTAWYGLIRTYFLASRFQEGLKEISSLNQSEFEALSRDFFHRGEYKVAVQLYSEAINRNSSESSYYRYRAACYRRLKNFDGAISDLRKAMEIDSNNRYERICLIDVLIECGRYDEAIAETLILDDSTDLILLCHRFLSLKKFHESLRCYTETIKRQEREENSTSHDGYEKRAFCHQQLGNLKEAIADYEISLELVGNNRAIEFNLCEVLLKAERYSDADKVLKNIENKYAEHFSAGESRRLQKIRDEIKEKSEEIRGRTNRR